MLAPDSTILAVETPSSVINPLYPTPEPEHLPILNSLVSLLSVNAADDPRRVCHEGPSPLSEACVIVDKGDPPIAR